MDKNSNEEKVLNSTQLHRDMNEERNRKGLEDIPVINNVSGASTGDLARNDKSWRTTAGFFMKMFKKKSHDK